MLTALPDGNYSRVLSTGSIDVAVSPLHERSPLLLVRLVIAVFFRLCYVTVVTAKQMLGGYRGCRVENTP